MIGLRHLAILALVGAAGGPPQQQDGGFNIALEALGGRVRSVTSERNGTTWAGSNLNDGLTFYARGLGCRPSCGWSSSDAQFPQDLVFSFHDDQIARINAVVLDTATQETIQEPGRIPKEVEVWTSSSDASGYVLQATATIEPRPAEHWIRFEPTNARTLRLRVRSNHGAERVQIAEVRIVETSDSPSILTTVDRNLADPALGGTVVWATSQYGSDHLEKLLNPGDSVRGWFSAAARRGKSAPGEEIVIAFRQDREAWLGRVVFEQAERSPAFRARTVAVLASLDSPLDGFDEIGRFELADETGEQSFPLDARARFVKLRFLDNYGGHRVSLGTVKLFERTAPGYRSVLHERPAAATAEASANPAADGPGAALTADRVESEPNDTPTQANAMPMGAGTAGTIDPQTDVDYFDLTVPAAPGVLNLELTGRPQIRTALTLTDPAGTTLKRFDPSRTRGSSVRLTWFVQRPDLRLRIRQPPSSIVLVFDTSGSMEGRIEDLEAGVKAFIDRIRPGERLNLIRFNDGEPEILLPDFSADRTVLTAAIEGKFTAAGETPLRDSIASALGLLEQASGNRALVVMTDGADAGSTLDSTELWRQLRDSDTRIHTIGLGWSLKARIADTTATGERFLAHIAAATGGRYEFVATSDQLGAIYTRISDELQALPSYIVLPTPSRTTGRLRVLSSGEQAAPVAAGTRVEFILDASGSMKRDVDGEPRIDVARRVMGEILAELPEDIEVAVRVYGRRIREGAPGDCEDTELLVPFASLDRAQILERVNRIEALGTTPLAHSIRQAGADLEGSSGRPLVILLTDGKEECGGDPVAAVAAVTGRGVDLRLNIVGFAMDDAASIDDLRRAASLAHGSFFGAADSAGLLDAVRQSLAIPFAVLDSAGDEIRRGTTGFGEVELPEGVYTVVVELADRQLTVRDVRITGGQVSQIEITEGEQVASIRLPAQ